MSYAFEFPKGKLVYVGQTNKLYKFNFRTLKTWKLFTLSRPGVIKHLCFINYHSFLFQISFAEKESNNLIMEFDLNTFKARKIIEGSNPLYMPNYNSFFCFRKAEKSKIDLCLVNLLDPSIQKVVTKLEDGITDNVIVPTSKHKIIFISASYANKNLTSQYDIKSGELKDVSIKNYATPVLWRGATKQLLCIDRERYQSFLVNLDGENAKYINVAYPIVYIRETDQMVISVPYKDTFTEHHGLYLYDFKTGKTKILVSDSAAGLGDAVYLIRKPRERY